MWSRRAAVRRSCGRRNAPPCSPSLLKIRSRDGEGPRKTCSLRVPLPGLLVLAAHGEAQDHAAGHVTAVAHRADRQVRAGLEIAAEGAGLVGVEGLRPEGVRPGDDGEVVLETPGVPELQGRLARLQPCRPADVELREAVVVGLRRL